MKGSWKRRVVSGLVAGAVVATVGFVASTSGSAQSKRSGSSPYRMRRCG